MTVRQAVLLVGGRATRMWPITAEVPKGLLPVAGIPFLEYQIRQLAAVGVEHVLLTVGTDLIDSWDAFTAEPVAGCAVDLIVETEPLDTAGGVRSALDRLDDRFFVLNGDVILETDLRLLAEGVAQSVEAAIALVEVEDTSAYGVVVTDADGIVERFVEKPPPEEAPARTVNAGMYLMSPAALERHPTGPLSFERAVFPDLAERRVLAGVVVDGRWLDIGTPTLYLDCHAAVHAGEVGLHVPMAHTVEDGAEVDGDIGGQWAWIGSGARIAEGAVVEESVIMPGAVVDAGATVVRGIVGDDARIGRDALVRGDSVVGPRAVVGPGCEVDHGARIAPDAILSERAVSFRPPQ